MRGEMKGQAFIILAIILVLILFLIKSLSPKDLMDEDGRVEGLEFENLKHEILKTVQISFPNEGNISKNLNGFLKFARNSLKSRGLELKVFLAKIYYSNITQNLNNSLNVSILNLLGSELLNLNITFSYDNSSRNFTSVQDEQVIETYFTFNANSNTNYTLEIFYRTNYEEGRERVSIPVKLNKSKFIMLTNLEFLSNNLEEREKLLEVYEIS